MELGEPIGVLEVELIEEPISIEEEEECELPITSSR